MRKSIYELIPDINDLLKRNDWFTEEINKDLSHAISQRLHSHFSDEKKPSLRLSKMGPQCPKALWGSIHAPDEAELLPPWAKFKYAYGHIIEAMVIALAKAAGHEVTGEQDEVIVDGISGHRDCIIDGCVVDIKSSSSFSFKKFQDGSIKQDDQFGYLEQLDGYGVGSKLDPLVRVKDRAFLIAVDKQLGHLCLYEHRIREDHIRSRIGEHKRVISLPDAPRCNCQTIPDGKSGNVRLAIKESYSAFKYFCFPNLRTFLYADGPRYLTKVVRTPDVQEVDRHGRRIFN